MRKKLLNPFLLISIIYIASLLVIWPFGEFVINDDWAYVRQIEATLLGNYKISSFITTSFISQVVLGTVWSVIVGFSLNNLRILTILVTFGFLFGFYKTVVWLLVKTSMESRNNTLVLFLLIIALFNPFVFHLSMSFMNDIYFMFFYIWSFYFFLTRKYYLGLLLSVIAFLTRQVGIVLFISYLIVLLRNYDWKRGIGLFASLLVSFVLLKVWPRYGGGSNEMGFLSFFAEPKTILENLQKIPYILCYYAYFLAPLSFLTVKNFTRKRLFWVVPITLISSYLLFTVDIFPIRNVFNLEGYYVVSDYSTTLSIYNNIPAKLFFSLFVSMAFMLMLVSLVLALLRLTSKVLEHGVLGIPRELQFIMLNWLGLLFIVFLGEDLYDRHLLPSIILFFLMFVYLIKDGFTRNVWSFLALAILVFHTFSIQYDFISVARLSWKQAMAVQKEKRITNQIYVNGTFAKYFNAKKQGDYTGDVASEPSANYLCYTREYVTPDKGFLSSVVSLHYKMERRGLNPIPPDSRKNTNVPPPRKNLQSVILQDDKFSFRFGLLGKKSSVVTWCSDKHTYY